MRWLFQPFGDWTIEIYPLRYANCLRTFYSMSAGMIAHVTGIDVDHDCVNDVDHGCANDVDVRVIDVALDWVSVTLHDILIFFVLE